MKITTKYNLGDKIWYYIKSENKYAWGKINRINIDIDKYENIYTEYMIKNRFYNPDYSIYSRNFTENRSFLDKKESEVFSSPKELKQELIVTYMNKINKATELK